MLSKKTKYGLKALTYIARSESDLPVRVGQVRDNTLKVFRNTTLADLSNPSDANSLS